MLKLTKAQNHKFILISHYEIQISFEPEKIEMISDVNYFNTASEIRQHCTEVKQEEIDKLDMGEIITYMNDAEDYYKSHIIIRVGNKYTGSPEWHRLPDIKEK